MHGATTKIDKESVYCTVGTESSDIIQILSYALYEKPEIKILRPIYQDISFTILTSSF